jgi:hypothetical protein
MYFVVCVPIVFRVPDACARACELDFAALEVLEIAHAVLVFKCAIDDVAEDEELGM